MHDLDSLMRHIGTVWECGPDRYPELRGMTSAQRTNFLVKHSHLHLSKTLGKIAGICEDFDHTGVAAPADAASLDDHAVRLFVSTLKLAEELGLSAADLLRRAPEFVN